MVNTWKELKENLPNLLAPNVATSEANSYFKILAETFYGQYNMDQLALQKPLNAELKLNLTSIISRLKAEEPIQYVLGHTWFYNLNLNVNPAVLIPRQETEELVHWILQDFQFKLSPYVWDIGTGSGCIALSLAAYMRSPSVWASDISTEALEVAKTNAQKNEIHNVRFLQHDILTQNPPNQSFDLIVSNPPYIKPSDKKLMSKNVLEHEPELALFADENDPLVFYRAIAKMAKQSLKPKGKLYFEINEFLKTELQDLMQAEGFTNLQFKKDLGGLWRMLRCEIN